MLFIMLDKSCNPGGEVPSQDTVSVTTTTKIEYDTVYTPNDTIQLPPVTKVVHDTIWMKDSTPVVQSSFTHEDSLIYSEVKAYSSAPVDSFHYEYKPKFPIYITKTITNDKEVVLENKPRFQVYAGATVGGSANSFGFTPMVQFKTRRDIIYTAGYDVVQNEVQVGILKKISFKRDK